MDFAEKASSAWAQIRPGSDLSLYAVALRVRRLALWLGREHQQILSAHGLDVPGDYDLMAYLRRHGPASVTELATQLLVTPAGVTGRLDRLEERHLATRVRDTDDRRIVHARLTPQGTALVDKCFRDWLAHLDRSLGPMLARSEIGSVNRFLEEALARHEREGGDGGVGPD